MSYIAGARFNPEELMFKGEQDPKFKPRKKSSSSAAAVPQLPAEERVIIHQPKGEKEKQQRRERAEDEVVDIGMLRLSTEDEIADLEAKGAVPKRLIERKAPEKDTRVRKEKSRKRRTV